MHVMLLNITHGETREILAFSPFPLLNLFLVLMLSIIVVEAVCMNKGKEKQN